MPEQTTPRRLACNQRPRHRPGDPREPRGAHSMLAALTARADFSSAYAEVRPRRDANRSVA